MYYKPGLAINQGYVWADADLNKMGKFKKM
jgi:hypothetical protein